MGRKREKREEKKKFNQSPTTTLPTTHATPPRRTQ